MEMNDYLGIIRMALWDKEEYPYQVTEADYHELESHAVLGLTASCLSRLKMSEELRKQWNLSILRQVSINCYYCFFESKIPITVPYAILKGTAAAQYYPHSEYRFMGDIDIITAREDFDLAYKQFIEDGYTIIKKLDREIGFVKNGIMIELHSYFSLLNDTNAAEYLDNMIIQSINETHFLPDMINGLVLLEHIDQHMEGGIGLRQIVDWMMFVDKNLPDSAWPYFQEQARRIGLEKLAVVTTRMCEMYLGLPSRQWCEKANPTLCDHLMQYVLSCGNFGSKRTDESSISEKAFTYARTPWAAYKLLQERGLANWEAARKHKWLRSFAWIYQIGRYVSKGLKRSDAKQKIMREYETARKINYLFNSLGIKRVSKGHTVLKDGKYISR